MKNKIISLFTAGLLTLSLVACSTTSTGPTPTEDAVIQLAAATSVELTVQKNPSYLVYFVGAEDVLASVATGTNAVTASTIELMLTLNGVTNPVVALALDQCLTLADGYIASKSGTNTTTSIVAIKQVAGDVATGIGEGLSLAGKATLKKKN